MVFDKKIDGESVEQCWMEILDILLAQVCFLETSETTFVDGHLLASEIILFDYLHRISTQLILGYPGAASRDNGIFMGESLQQERESPWALTLTEFQKRL